MSSVAAEFQITRGGNAPHSWGATDSVQRFAVVLHDIDADRRGEADTLTISVDFEDHVMDGFAALNRYIVERSPHHRFQPNAGPMTADPDVAARRRSLAVASLPCFHVPENTRQTGNGAVLALSIARTMRLGELAVRVKLNRLRPQPFHSVSKR